MPSSSSPVGCAHMLVLPLYSPRRAVVDGVGPPCLHPELVPAGNRVERPHVLARPHVVAADVAARRFLVGDPLGGGDVLDEGADDDDVVDDDRGRVPVEVGEGAQQPLPQVDLAGLAERRIARAGAGVERHQLRTQGREHAAFPAVSPPGDAPRLPHPHAVARPGVPDHLAGGRLEGRDGPQSGAEVQQAARHEGCRLRADGAAGRFAVPDRIGNHRCRHAISRSATVAALIWSRGRYLVPAWSPRTPATPRSDPPRRAPPPQRDGYRQDHIAPVRPRRFARSRIADLLESGQSTALAGAGGPRGGGPGTSPRRPRNARDAGVRPGRAISASPRWLPAWRKRSRRRTIGAPKFYFRGRRRGQPAGAPGRAVAGLGALRPGVRELGLPRAVGLPRPKGARSEGLRGRERDRNRRSDRDRAVVPQIRRTPRGDVGFAGR